MSELTKQAARDDVKEDGSNARRRTMRRAVVDQHTGRRSPEEIERRGRGNRGMNYGIGLGTAGAILGGGVGQMVGGGSGGEIGAIGGGALGGVGGYLYGRQKPSRSYQQRANLIRNYDADEITDLMGSNEDPEGIVDREQRRKQHEELKRTMREGQMNQKRQYQGLRNEMAS